MVPCTEKGTNPPNTRGHTKLRTTKLSIQQQAAILKIVQSLVHSGVHIHCVQCVQSHSSETGYKVAQWEQSSGAEKRTARPTLT